MNQIALRVLGTGLVSGIPALEAGLTAGSLEAVDTVPLGVGRGVANTVLARGLFIDGAIDSLEDAIDGRGRLVLDVGTAGPGTDFEDMPSEVLGRDVALSVEGRAETEEGRGPLREARVPVACGFCGSALVDRVD
ncbi:hypothetical protein M407DRAFT_240701 [Tulasnella calospora MUT 4182]|uniref:Uncharacterized protein n=1 Tax=Tulasnella calospora MUT 4182 TaxID=1051891 RepID=A0A0C3ML51_9AGAM|nr:hypothetical protein M407DRAFT_240701 [Tulasnella calospora MUT 4182]